MVIAPEEYLLAGPLGAPNHASKIEEEFFPGNASLLRMRMVIGQPLSLEPLVVEESAIHQAARCVGKEMWVRRLSSFSFKEKDRTVPVVKKNFPHCDMFSKICIQFYMVGKLRYPPG